MGACGEAKKVPMEESRWVREVDAELPQTRVVVLVLSAWDLQCRSWGCCESEPCQSRTLTIAARFEGRKAEEDEVRLCAGRHPP